MNDTPSQVAFNEVAPQDERYDAHAELQKSALSELIPRPEIQPVIDYILDDLAEQEMRKALAKPNIIPFPSKAVKNKQPGMQSVYLDDMQVSVMGHYYDKPGVFSFDSMRAMVEQTPILNSVIMTRIRQVQRFCRIQESGRGPGFEIKLKDREAEVTDTNRQSIQLMQDFMLNCGWEAKPRQRMRLKRDDFTSFVAKLTRDSLTMDSMAIETEYKRDRKLGMDGLYAVDGSTIRLCTEDGYEGDDEIFALQVVQGRIRTAYTYDDLIYVPRNPRTDVLTGGYGLAETELLIRVVTGFLNAMTYNQKYFDSNAIPKGLLHLSGNYSEKDLSAFKRYWNAMVKGVNNAWTLPVMVSKDQESRAAFERFGVDVDEMMFSKWMTFLASIICAIYGISPDEINFESFSASKSSLSGSDTSEKLANSKDSGLRPLLTYLENIFSDFIIQDFSEQYVFRWTGLDEEDEEKRHEIRKLVLKVNEIRAQEGYDKLNDKWGEAPVNPALLGAWQSEQQQNDQDFGNPDEQGSNSDQEDQSDFGDAGENQGDQQEADYGDAGDNDDETAIESDDEENLGKSFGLPVYTFEV
ncbi:phage portal protein [Nitrosomonas sp. Nm58]|uniref:phage portal protein n=1 Tax=Nitrosomonas sp. Nm58 TaxID=200126 RepID=UPI0008962231|nr:phage portal protein [Nitrosomonas sp. Nm58]SDY38689.1 Phage portal protein [Nitrosomonas sp. Nm58]